MVARRTFLGGLFAATATAPVAGWAAAGAPSWIGAAKEAGGTFALFGIDETLGRVFRIPLPARAHAGAAHPTRAEAVVFARRPGTFALIVDCASGRRTGAMTSPSGRHFYGHGAFLNGGDLLATTENDIETGEGRIGLWDVTDGYRRAGEFPSGGIGPHEVLRLPGSDVLAIANGGIRTDPDHGREKLNLDTMRPNLTYAAADGTIVEQVDLGPDNTKASTRHLSVRPDGTLAVALQWQLDETGPLLALHRRGTPPTLGELDPAMARDLEGYAGSIAWSGDGTRAVLTGPRGGLSLAYDAAGRLLGTTREADVCGAAPAGDGVLLSTGEGRLIRDDGTTRHHPCAWDNHLIAVG